MIELLDQLVYLSKLKNITRIFKVFQKQQFLNRPSMHHFIYGLYKEIITNVI